MSKSLIVRSLALIAVLGLTIAATSQDQAVLHLRATLTGFEESPPKLTNGMGTFSAVVTDSSMTYTLTFSDLSTPAFMSHIHFAQKGVNGGIFIWLCGSTTAPGPAGTPACPAGGGTVTRTVSAGDVVAIPTTADQGVSAGNFAGALRIIRSGDAYVNVHTTRYPGGEIRGQVSVNGVSGE